MDFRIRLGQNPRNRNYGEWWIHEETASADLGTPKVLWQNALHGAEVFPKTPINRIAVEVSNQVLTEAALIVVTDVDPSDGQWELRAYDRETQLGEFSPPADMYLQFGKTPYQTISFALEKDNGKVARFRVTESGIFGDRVHLYHWEKSGQSYGWKLDQIDPERGHIRSERVTESPFNGGLKTKEKQILEADGTLVAKSITTIKRFPFGEYPVSVQRFNIDSGAESGSQTTSFTYHNDDSLPGYGLVKEIYNDYDGMWTETVYGPDGLAELHSTYLDAGQGSASAQHKVTAYAYSTGEFGLGSNQDEAKITTVSIAGSVISRKVTIWYGDEKTATLPGGGNFDYRERWDISLIDPSIATVAGALASGSNALVTRTRRYASGDFRGLVHSKIYPDGTGSITQYNGAETITYTGELSADGLSLVDGVRESELMNAYGRTIARESVAIPENLVLVQDLALTVDSLGRPTHTQHLGGLSSYASYSCCGLDSETDVRGTTTTYSRDMLNRVHRTTRLGIVTDYSIDALGRTLSRTDTAGGTAITRQTTTTDSLGLDVSTADALNRTTQRVMTYPNGSRVTTTTNPDLAVSVEEYYSDGKIKSITGPPVYPRRYAYGVGQTAGGVGDQISTTTYVLDRNGADTGEWTRTWRDAVGRAWKSESSSGASFTNEFNVKGQLVKTVDADGVATLYSYNNRGQRTHTVVDINQNGTIDFGGPDRISKVAYSVAQKNGQTVSKTISSIWRETGEEQLTTTEHSADGLQSWTTLDGVNTHRQTVLAGGGSWTVTQTNGDSSTSVQSYTNGRLQTEQYKKADGTVLRGTTYGWDDHGRLLTSTDARNGATTMTWYDSDELQSVTTPAPGVGGGAAQTTSFTYDAMGRTDITTLPDSTTVDNDYFATGDMEKVTGSRTYTREYDYDSTGRRTSLVTNPGTAEAQTTEWIFDPVTGRLQSKKIAGATTASYTYTTAGRLDTKTNARNIVTDYGYNSAGDVQSITYSDGTTPDVTFTHRRTGDIYTVAHSGSTYTYDYGLPGEWEKTTISGGILDGAIIDPGYDTFHQRSTLAVNPGHGAATVSQSWGYETGSSRLETVSQGGYSATYSYDPNSSLIATTSFASGGQNRHTETRVYDQLNRLRSVAHLSSAALNAVSKSFTYTYNDANQRTRTDREDGTYWSYGYDAFGHLEDASKHLADNSPLAGHQYGYDYDSLGNRTSATFGGDATGTAGLQTIGYTAKTGDRNQYDTITTPGVVLTRGKANTNAVVTVNSEIAQDRQGEHFAHQTSVANELGAVLQQITVIADDGTDTDTVTRDELVPDANSAYEYDADGNVTFDGYREFTWDAENRLLSVQSRSGLSPPGATEYKVEYAYDFLSRRIERKASQKIGNHWYTVQERRYLYDGWNVIAEISGDNSGQTLEQSYLWGLDLSNSLQGAGGVGGLLAIERHTGSQAGVHFASHDGNGNVVALTNAGDGEQSASYEYDPFGNLLEMSGVFAAQNPYRFSTKRQDALTGLYDYGYRTYDPVTGRWLSRDPIAESGGLNLYGFILNDPLMYIDVLGREPATIEGVTIQMNKGKAILSLQQYWTIFNKRWQNRHKEHDSNRIRNLKKGCVGVSCVNLGYNDPPLDNCFSSKKKAMELKALWESRKHCEFGNQRNDNRNPSRPRIFAIRVPEKAAGISYWKNGKVTFPGWARKPGAGVNFDYGYLNDEGYFEHANHVHKPNNPMLVYISTETVFTKKLIDFDDRTIWCIACERPCPQGRTGTIRKK